MNSVWRRKSSRASTKARSMTSSPALDPPESSSTIRLLTRSTSLERFKIKLAAVPNFLLLMVKKSSLKAKESTLSGLR